MQALPTAIVMEYEYQLVILFVCKKKAIWAQHLTLRPQICLFISFVKSPSNDFSMDAITSAL